MGLGLGYGRVVAESTGDSNDVKATYTGLGPAYELLIGGTLGSGFVLGGGFVGQDVTEPDVEVTTANVSVSGSIQNQSLGIVAVGLFLDWFPDPKGGAHVGLLIGPANIGLQNENGGSADGSGASLFGGYDFWIGKQWSLGVEGRFVAVLASHDRYGASYDDAATSYQLMLTALLH